LNAASSSIFDKFEHNGDHFLRYNDNKTSRSAGERMSYVRSVQRAIEYIEEHLEDELDLSSIADEAYISVAQLYRFFYALTGHPVKEYVRKRRMSVAANLLRNSDLTVEKIAWDIGFEYYHSFAKVFKRIVGLTPAAYRKAELFYSFEPAYLQEQVAYMEDKELTALFPDIKVVRCPPDTLLSYLHISQQEAGMENEAFRIVFEHLAMAQAAGKSKIRILGHNVDLPDVDGNFRYGYKVLIMGAANWHAGDAFTEEPFVGGLYAVRKISASSPEIIQDGWNRLLSEWLPKSTFEIGTHQYFEEFITYNGKVTRMNLYLPVQRKLYNEPVEIVERTEMTAYYCRGYGAKGQAYAEQRLIAWFESQPDRSRLPHEGRYYMAFDYALTDPDSYWWENGIIAEGHARQPLEGLESKPIRPGLYACCVSKPYGLLTGVLDRMLRWIAANDRYRLDEDRQWFAEYHLLEGVDAEQDSLVKVYIPLV
jgi:AraC family transcriptional regulator